MQAAVARVVGLLGQQPRALLQRLGTPALPIEHGRVVVPGRIEGRRELETALQKPQRIGITEQARRHLREHAQGRHIIGLLRKMGPQQGFCLRNPVVAESPGGPQQPWIACRCLDVVRVRPVGGVSITAYSQLIGQSEPGIGQIRPLGYGLSQRIYRAIDVAGHGARQSQDHQRLGLPRNHFQDLARLLGGDCRLDGEQTRRVRQRDFECPDRLCAGAQDASNLPEPISLFQDVMHKITLRARDVAIVQPCSRA